MSGGGTLQLLLLLQHQSPFHHHHHHHHHDYIIVNESSSSTVGKAKDKQCQAAAFNPKRKPPFLTLAAAAATSSTIPRAFSGFGSQYSASAAPGELMDASGKQQRQRKRIAGIDQDELLDPKLLADPDSCFCEFRGVEIHHKIYDASSQASESSLSHGHDALAVDDQSPSPSPSLKLGIPMILLHGFGASVFSWNKVMKPLAHLASSKVLAFDRPAFGLTSRLNTFAHITDANAKPLNPYSTAFSVLATLHFIDILGTDKAILVGHSAGSLIAVDAYFEAPERVAALILVAPAIFAPRAIPKVVERNGSPGNNQTKGDSSGSNNTGKPHFKLLEVLIKFTKYITEAITRMIKGMADVFNSLYKKALSSILRSAFTVILVRMIINKFGTAAVRTAWYDSKQVTEQILEGYTKPLRVKDWDRALVEFTAAILINGMSETKPPLAKRLHQISCPVLIVTGDTDRLVPAWNAERLSRAIPQSKLEVIKNCGHLPHEEKVEEFVKVIEQFLRRYFANSESEKCSLRAVT